MIGLSSTSNAERYALDSARLQVPNQPGVFVAPDNATMLAALGAASDTGVPGVTQVDPAKAGAGAYPLTQVMWGAMRLDGSTPDERRDYAAFIEQVTTTGQTPGTAIGQLPPGYAPLTEELRAKAAEAVKKIRAYTDPTEAPPVDAPDGGGAPPPPTGPGNPNAPAPPPAGPGTTPVSGGPNVGAGAPPADAGTTETNAPSGFTGMLSALGGVLLLGASGAIAVPGILRRRDTPLL